jgi:5-methylcytosine-specific restriction endonuclease McrA
VASVKKWKDMYHQCIVCGATFSIDPHHRLPKSKGGTDDPDNVVAMCRDHHEEFHNTCGVITTSRMSTKVLQRVTNAKKWFKKYPRQKYPEAYKALPPHVLEEAFFHIRRDIIGE